MSLILPPWAFAYCTDCEPSTPSFSSHGVSVTPGTSNADGTPVTLIAAIGHDVHRLVVHVSDTAIASAAHYALLDILTDPAGGTSWGAWIDDLLCGFLVSNSGVQDSGFWLDFPIWLPAGSSIGAQMRTSHTVAGTPRVSVWAFGEPSRPDMWWCGQGVETLGVTAASSRGTSHTAGVSGAYSSWASVGSPTTKRFGAIQLALGGTDASAAANSFHFQVGKGSQPLPGFPLLLRGTGTNENGAQMGPGGPVWCNVESGAQMQVRGRGSAGASEAMDVAIYGVY